MTRAVLGVIGGSGLYDLPGIKRYEQLEIESPWGSPSARLSRGEIEGTQVVFLPRHGKGHRISPSDINYHANVDCLKRAGVTDLISISACGSFREELAPGTFVVVDQFVDRTYRGPTSFFGTGCVAHVSMAHPVGPKLAARLVAGSKAENIPSAEGGTYVCIEGPQFSTLAESLSYKAAGFDVVGMTNLPEAKLAREAEITYASVAMVTDYDAWHESGPVDVASVIKILKENAQKAGQLIARVARDFPQEHETCPVGSDRALEYAIITAPDHRDAALLAKLDAVAGRVLGERHD